MDNKLNRSQEQILQKTATCPRLQQQDKDSHPSLWQSEKQKPPQTLQGLIRSPGRSLDRCKNTIHRHLAEKSQTSVSISVIKTIPRASEKLC